MPRFSDEKFKLGHYPDEGHQLTLTEQHHRECLTEEMTFQEMAVGLGWTYREVVSAGCVRELTRRLRRLRYLVVVSETVAV